MIWDYSPYVLPSLIATVILVWLGRYTWRRRQLPGSRIFSTLMYVVAGWSLAYAFELGLPILELKIPWAIVGVIIGEFVPVVWLAFAFDYSGRESWLVVPNLLLLSVVPVTTSGLALTNYLHKLVWSSSTLDSSGPFLALVNEPGPWNFISTTYSYSLLLVGAILLVRSTWRPLRTVYRWQAVILVTGLVTPWLGNALYRQGISPIPNLDLTSFGFMLSGLILTVGVFRFRLVAVIPIARQTVLDNIRDAIFILDTESRVVDMNESAQRVLGELAFRSIGRHLGETLIPRSGESLLPILGKDEQDSLEVTLGDGDAIKVFNLSITNIEDQKKVLRGRLAILRDITARKKAEQALVAQKTLFQNLVAVAKATSERPTLEATLRDALNVSMNLAGAQRGSMVLVDDHGRVQQSIYLSESGTATQPPELIEAVMATGLSGWSFRHRQPALIDDVTQDDRWLEFPERGFAPGSALAVPILNGPNVLGVLTLRHSQKSRFEADDLLLLQSAAEQMSLALRNAQLYDKQLQLARSQKTLYDTLSRIGQHLDPESVAQEAVSAVVTLTGWSGAAIMEPDHSGTQLLTKAAAGELVGTVGTSSNIEESLCGRSFSMGVVQYEPAVDEFSFRDMENEARFSELAVPLGRGSIKLGVLVVVGSKADAFSSSDIRLAESLAEAISLALENAKLFHVIEEEHNRLRALIHSSRDGILLAGQHQEILVVNKTALSFLSLDGIPEEWVGHPLGEAMVTTFQTATHTGQLKDAVTVPFEPGEKIREGEIISANHAIHWMAVPVETGSRDYGQLLVLHDVTEERNIEKMREDLTGMMVHDLRNPLNNILSGLELIPVVGPLTDEQARVLNITGRVTRQMRDIVNSIMELSELESGEIPLDPRPLSVSERVETALQSQMALANTRDIRLENGVSAETPIAWGDPDLIDRVFQNLIGNAITFSPDGGVVTVSLAPIQDSEEFLTICVCDEGPGIEPGFEERLFDKFTSSRERRRGYGLGMTFCKLVAEAHGGRIVARSRPDKGAEFLLTLPTASAERLRSI